MTIQEKKKLLRRQIMETIRSLPPEYARAADAKILSTLLCLKEYRAAETVFCFLGTSHEIQTAPFLEQILSDGKKLAVPLCISKGIMEARQITALSELVPGFYGLSEPASDAPPVPPSQIDLAVIPCLTCDRQGRRLGHGGGYYDIYFSANPGIRGVLICREKVMAPDLSSVCEPHDLIFPTVISESGIYTASEVLSEPPGSRC